MYTNKPKHMDDGTGDHPLGGTQEVSCALSAPPCPHPPFLVDSAGGHPPVEAATLHTEIIWPEKHKPNRGVPAVPAHEAGLSSPSSLQMPYLLPPA